MNCDEFLQRISESSVADARMLAHAASCSRCAALLGTPLLYAPRPEFAQAALSSLRADLSPVRPVASDRVLSVRLLIAVAAAVAAGAVATGVHSHRGLRVATWFVLYASLSVAAAGAAIALPARLRPGSRPRPGAVLALTGLCLFAAVAAATLGEVLVASWFRSGISCLILGTLWGAITGLAVWAILRRGFWAGPRTGALAGLLAGVTGLAGLTVHCAILDRSHVLVWHAAVLLVLASLGVLLVKLRT